VSEDAAKNGAELDALEFLKAGAELAELVAAGTVNSIQRKSKRALVVRLARRIVLDALLTDEEVVIEAGKRAIRHLGPRKA